MNNFGRNVSDDVANYFETCIIGARDHLNSSGRKLSVIHEEPRLYERRVFSNYDHLVHKDLKGAVENGDIKEVALPVREDVQNGSHYYF